MIHNQPGNSASLSSEEMAGVRIPRNDSRIEPLNHLLHYFAKRLGVGLPLLGG
jgi:hypothetical protein